MKTTITQLFCIVLFALQISYAQTLEEALEQTKTLELPYSTPKDAILAHYYDEEGETPLSEMGVKSDIAKKEILLEDEAAQELEFDTRRQFPVLIGKYPLKDGSIMMVLRVPQYSISNGMFSSSYQIYVYDKNEDFFVYEVIEYGWNDFDPMDDSDELADFGVTYATINKVDNTVEFTWHKYSKRDDKELEAGAMRYNPELGYFEEIEN